MLLKNVIYSKTGQLILYIRYLFGFLSILSILSYFFAKNGHDIRAFGILFLNTLWYGNQFILSKELISFKFYYFWTINFDKKDIISIHKEYIMTASYVPPYRIKYLKIVDGEKTIKTVDFFGILFSNSDEFIEAIRPKS